MIPPDKQTAVKKALEAAFGVDNFEDIFPLTKGLSDAAVFKIVVQGSPYVLRIITRTETRDNPAYYFGCLQTAASAGIAPAIHYLDIEDRISIIDFIQEQYFPVPGARIKMADMLRDLHSLPKFSYQLNYLDASDTFLRKFLAADIVPENDIKDLLRLYERIRNAYPRNDPDNLVSCHNDVKRDNIIFDGIRPWLVDWEAARLNDRYMDLAAIANFVVKNEKDETDFLKRYFGESFDEYKQARFFLMSQIVHMLCFTLCSIPGSAGKSIDINMSTPGFNEFHDRLWNCEISLANNREILHYALVHMKELRNNMQTKRFEDSLRIVAGNSTSSFYL
jgi:aminoglycoside phosphotransferase (APT) family kinase protein